MLHRQDESGRINAFLGHVGAHHSSWANESDTEAISQETHGSPTRGEENSLHACSILVRTMNLSGGNWDEPFECPDRNDPADCIAKNCIDGIPPLRVQVVKALLDTTFWEHGSNSGKYEWSGKADDACDRVMKAFQKKVKRYDDNTRAQLVLALDACLLPGFSFHCVLEKIQSQHAATVKAGGFREVWIVGPNEQLTHRVDSPAPVTPEPKS